MNKFNNFYKGILYPNRIWVYIGTILIVFWNYIVRELSKILLPITSSVPNNNPIIAIIFLLSPFIIAFLHIEMLNKERHPPLNRYIAEFIFVCIYEALKLSNDFTFYSYSFIEYIGGGIIAITALELILFIYQKLQINKEKSEAKPIIESSPFYIDTPTKEDKYGRKKYAKLLLDKIIVTKDEKNPQHSFVINIGENYGYGKTSFFNFLKEELKETKVRIISFDYKPWLCDNANAIITEFFQTLRNELKLYNPQLDKKINNYTKLLLKDCTRQVGLSYIGTLFNSSHTLKEEHDEIANTIKNINMPIIIFIDDVDRLQNDELMVLLKLIRDTADFANIFYILAADKPFLINNLNSLGIEYPEEYLKKFINYEFTFPADDSITMKLFKENLSTLLNKYLEEEQAEKECISICTLIKNNIPFKNMRDVQRFLNNYVYMLDAIKMNREKINVDFTDLFALTLIQYLHPELYKVLRDNDAQILTISNRRFILKDEYSNVFPDKEIQALFTKRTDNPKDSQTTPMLKNIKDIIADSNIIDEQIAMNLLKFLFGDKNNYRAWNRICQVDAYFSYFSAELKNNQISQNEVQEILDLDDLTAFEARIEDVIKSDKIQSFIHKTKYIAERFQKDKVDLINKLFMFIEKNIDTKKASYISKVAQEEVLFKEFELSIIIYYLFNKEQNQFTENDVLKIDKFIDRYRNLNLCALFLERFLSYHPNPFIFNREQALKWKEKLADRYFNEHLLSTDNPLDEETLDIIHNLKGNFINSSWEKKFLEYINNSPNYMDWFARIVCLNNSEFKWNENYMKQMGWDFRKNLEDFINACQHKNDDKLQDLLNMLRLTDLKDLKIEEHPFLQYLKNKQQ